MIPIHEKIKVAIKDTIKGPSPISVHIALLISFIASTEEPKITGMTSKNEYLTAVSRDRPIQRAATSVEPEREMPGSTAIV